MTTANQLTPAQHAILAYAHQHTEGKITWFPENIKGGARKKVIDGLFNRALITYDGTDWTASATGGAVRWTGPSYAANVNGNALRFSTLYNFSFDSNAAPAAGSATLGLFKPGTEPSIAIATQVPSGPAGDPSDLNGDGSVNAADLALLLGNWGGIGVGDVNDDGGVDAADLAIMLGSWG